jgi:RimJ/RimL family protein N-acetyltransferase
MSKIFDCNENYTLEDDVALLRPLLPEDFDHLLGFSLNEPQLWKYSLVSAAGEKGLQHYMKLTLDARRNGQEYPFIVFDKRTNEYAGSTRFYDIQPDYQTLQIGYTWYGTKFQGTGLNKHCKYLLLSFAFEQAGMERVEFRADNNNERSIAAMKSIGCKVDGILRSNMPTREQGRRRDSIILSILKDEWFAEVKEKLSAKLV